MNDIEKMQNAMKFIECLANGIHPITGEILKETVFDEPEIIRCLFFVKEILQDNIKRPQKNKKEDFVIADNLQLEQFLQEEPICLTPFVTKIKEANNGIGPSAKKIWNILIEKRFLHEGINLNGDKAKLPTELGEQSGLSCVERHSSTGKIYYVVVYNRKGQELLLDCIKEIYS